MKEPITAPQITKEMMKNFKTLECTCGGMIFDTGFVFKKVSPLLSPSGKEELYPVEVFICKQCGKVPVEFFSQLGILPDEVLAKSNLVLNSPGTGGISIPNTLTQK